MIPRVRSELLAARALGVDVVEALSKTKEKELGAVF